MDTIRVERGNVVLDIPYEDKAEYMRQGFSVIDVKSGKVVEEAMAQDVATLQHQVVSLKARIAELESAAEALKAENEELAGQLKKKAAKKSE